MRLSAILLILVALFGCSYQNRMYVSEGGRSRDSIVGGQAVKVDNPLRPYVVMIFGEPEEGSPYICTGTFVSPSAILTAGHCVIEDISFLKIFYGLSPFHDENGVFELKATKVIRHRDYKKDDNNRNDLAVIHFSGGLPPGARVASLEAEVKSSALVTALGYGQTSGLDDARASSTELRSVEIQLQLGEKIHNSFVAQQANGKGVCFGDSGGPAFTQENDLVQIVAVASAVDKLEHSASSSDPCLQASIYMSVHAYKDWIQKQIDFSPLR